MVNINSTQYLLKYNSTFTAVSISSGSSAYQLWKIDEEEDGDGILYYYLRPNASGGSGKALNNSLGFSNVTAGSCTDQCGWEILNKRDIPVSVTPIQNAGIAAGDDIKSAMTIVPSGAETMFFWYSDGDGVFGYNEDDDYTYLSGGIHHIWMEERYSGTYVEEEDDWIVLAYDNTNYDNNRTYMIRPCITDYSNLLTLTETNDPLTNDLSAEPFCYGESGNNPAYSAKWTDKSQTFTFSYSGNGKYKIGATLAAEQYSNVPQFSYDTQHTPEYNNNNYNNSLQFESYNMTNYDNVLNWISSTGGKAVAKNYGNNWYIILDGTVSHNNKVYNRYIIACVDGSGNVKALKNNGSNVSIDTYTNSSNYKWIIYQVGINAPLIKQTKTFYCGYATILQAIYGASKNQALENQIGTDLGSNIPLNIFNNDISNLASQQDYLKCKLGYTDMMSQDDICGDLNDGAHISTSIFDNSVYSYNRIPSASQIQSSITFQDIVQNPNQGSGFVDLIIGSLSTGWIPFFMTGTQSPPYMMGGGAAGSAHYIAVVGYDCFSNTILISNCHYCDGALEKFVFGNYAISTSNVYNNVAILFFASCN